MTNEQSEQIRQKAIQFVKDHGCCCCPEHLTAFAESLLSGGAADSGTPAEVTLDGIETPLRLILDDAIRWDVKESDGAHWEYPECELQALIGAIVPKLAGYLRRLSASAAPPAASPQPAPMLLACPKCNKRHHDSGEWETRSHKTHLCVDDIFGKGCGHEFRPYDFPTVGVIDIEAHRSYMRLGTLVEDYNALMVKYEALRAAYDSGTPANSDEDQHSVIVTKNSEDLMQSMRGTPATPSAPKLRPQVAEWDYESQHEREKAIMALQEEREQKVIAAAVAAERIAKRVFDEDWKRIEAEKTELLSLDELRAIIEQELTR